MNEEDHSSADAAKTIQFAAGQQDTGNGG